MVNFYKKDLGQKINLSITYDGQANEDERFWSVKTETFFILL